MSDVERLRHVLAATGPPPDELELREVLWLACHIDGEPEPTSEPAVPMADDPGVAPRPPVRKVPDRPAPAAPPPRTPVHPAPTAEPATVGKSPKAEEVLVPTAPMLADPRGVQRALRPLKRRVPSRRRRELDEEATAAQIAESNLWAPVLEPAPERWLTLDLVVDTGPTMRLWRPLGRELAEVLVRQGAFQDVQVSYLDGDRVSGAPGRAPQAPGTLLDASGRHAVLVLSDCSGPHWWDGRAHRAVRRWARTGPTAILQPLPERMWRRTAAPTTPGVAVLPRPGGPNTDLRFVPFDGDVPPGVPVPVLEVAPRWFGAWADLVSGTSPRPVAVALPPPSRPTNATPVERERELPVDERVRRFLTTASPAAAELAAHVAVSVPSLPVMRLIQHRILGGGSGPGQLAEVLLSGLLRPADGVHYEFVPGAREALLDTLPRPEAQHTRHVLEAVSAEIERRAGTAAEVFRALVPSAGGRVSLVAATDHFAVVTPQTRSHLTPAPASPEPPSLWDLRDAPKNEFADEHWWYRWVGAVPFGVDASRTVIHATVWDGRNDDAPLITGPAGFRRRVLQTMILELAYRRSPDTVEFFLVEGSEEMSFNELGALPHVTSNVSADTLNSPLVGRLIPLVEAEHERRIRILRQSSASDWREYQLARTKDPSALERLPALIVVVDDANALFASKPDLAALLVRLCTSRPDTGIRCVFSGPDLASAEARLPLPTRWRIEPSDSTPEDGFAVLRSDRDLESYLADSASTPVEFRLPQLDDEVRPIVDFLARRVAGAPEASGRTEHDEKAGERRPDLPAQPLSQESDEPNRRTGEVWEALAAVGGDVHGQDPDVLELNRLSGPTSPDERPQPPVIGLDDSGDAVSPYPLGIRRDMPHGLIVGDTEARQRMLRVLTLAVAATHSPEDVSFIFGGMGEHPLGRDLDLPHVVLAEEELLGSPDRLQGFLEHLSDQLLIDSGGGFSGRAATLVVVDVSLTLPSSRPEVADTLLRLARRGMGRDVALVLSSASVGRSAPWDRLLPLLDWRIAVNPLDPSEQRRVLRRPRLDWPSERTAHLLPPGRPVHRFTVAREPDDADLDAYLRRAREIPPARPVPITTCTIMACDVASFEDTARAGDARALMRKTLYSILDRSLRAAGVGLEDCYSEDRGDGAMVLVPPTVGTDALLTPAVDMLKAELRRYNETASEAARMKMRVAVHTGKPSPGGNGVAGTAVNHTFRILETPTFKDALNHAGASLAVAVSQLVYDQVVRDGSELLDLEEYQQIEVHETAIQTSAWVRIPGLVPDLLAMQEMATTDFGPTTEWDAVAPGAVSEVVDRMVDVPLMASQAGRDQVLGVLQYEIAEAVPRHADASMDVYSIVTTCLDHPGGLQDLLEAIKALSGESMPVLRLEEAVGPLLL